MLRRNTTFRVGGGTLLSGAQAFFCPTRTVDSGNGCLSVHPSLSVHRCDSRFTSVMRDFQSKRHPGSSGCVTMSLVGGRAANDGMCATCSRLWPWTSQTPSFHSSLYSFLTRPHPIPGHDDIHTRGATVATHTNRQKFQTCSRPKYPKTNPWNLQSNPAIQQR